MSCVVIGNFDAWIDRTRNDESRERRSVLKDYVHFILDTGVRPGTPLRLEGQRGRIDSDHESVERSLVGARQGRFGHPAEVKRAAPQAQIAALLMRRAELQGRQGIHVRRLGSVQRGSV